MKKKLLIVLLVLALVLIAALAAKLICDRSRTPAPPEEPEAPTEDAPQEDEPET